MSQGTETAAAAAEQQAPYFCVNAADDAPKFDLASDDGRLVCKLVPKNYLKKKGKT